MLTRFRSGLIYGRRFAGRACRVGKYRAQAAAHEDPSHVNERHPVRFDSSIAHASLSSRLRDGFSNVS